MENGVCPKCNSQNIYTSKDKTLYYGDRTNVQINTFKALRTIIYICTDCRFIEEYIKPGENIDKVTKHWNKV